MSRRASRRNFLPAPALHMFKKNIQFADSAGRLYSFVGPPQEKQWALFESDVWSSAHRVLYIWRKDEPRPEPGEELFIVNDKRQIYFRVEQIFPTRKKVESIIGLILNEVYTTDDG